MTCYYLAGIRIQTQIELPLPVSTTSAQEAEVSLFEGSRLTASEAPTTIGWDWSDPSRPTVSYPGVGIATVIEGREIELRPCGPKAEWRGLIQPVFAALMYQRGVFCIHGSTVCREGEAIGFVGACGAGKSTMVAQLTNNGWHFLSDDLLFINPDSAGGVQTWPGFSVLKLAHDSAQVTGKHLSSIGPLYPDAVKDGFFPADELWERKPQSLRTLFLLEEGDEISIQEMSRAEALFELFENTYGAQVFEGKPPAEYFQKIAEISNRIQIYRFIRPKDYSRMGEVRDCLTSFTNDQMAV
ncbi:MAG TPA: hypothetical protein VK041_01255 [Opitutales bacterium]|nr:hypothetical protein [Opitutales bacterium]